MTSGLYAFLERVLTTLGYPGIALVMFAETIFPPIPSEMVMPLAGFLVGRGQLSLTGVVLAGTTGAVLGGLALYGLGSWLGEARLRRFVRRYGRWLLLSETDLDRALAFFGRYRAPAVFLARFVPGARSLISLPAGLSRMPLLSFLVLTALGTALWNGLLASAGLLLGRNWERVVVVLERYGLFLYLVAGALVVAFIAFRLWRRRSKPTPNT